MAAEGTVIQTNAGKTKEDITMADDPADYSKDAERVLAVEVQEKDNIIGRSINKLKGTTTDVLQGTQLLAIDVAAATGLLRRVLIGDELTDKEKQALRRTLTDLAAVIPIGFLMLLPVTAVGHAAMLAAIQRYVPSLEDITMADDPADYSKDAERVLAVEVQEKDNIIGRSINKLKGTTTIKPPSPTGRFTQILSVGIAESEVQLLDHSLLQRLWRPIILLSRVDHVGSNGKQTDSVSHQGLEPHLADEAKSNSLLLSSSRGKRVQEKGVDSFDIDMVNTYLSIYLTKGKLSLACKLFEIFTDLGVDPVSYTYNSLMSSLVKKGYLKEAYRVLSEMGEKVSAIDVATYNMIFQALGKMGRADLASTVLSKLTEGGFLDLVMYNTLINVLGKGGRLNEANRVVEQMKKSGINPDVVTYNTLIEVHSKAGRLKEAHQFLKMMVDAGCAPNHVTDTTLDFLEKEIAKQKQR